MPVSPVTAYNLLCAFGLLEFELKRIPEFVGVGPYRFAKVRWQAVEDAVDRLSTLHFVDQVSTSSRGKLLGGARNRPKVQVVHVFQGRNVARFEELLLPDSDAKALVQAARRVRNNLFHGGKQDPLEEPCPGDDEEWGAAAQEVAELLLDMVRRQRLSP